MQGKTTVINLLQFAAQYLTIPCTVRSDRFANTVPRKARIAFHVPSAIFWHKDRIYAVVAEIERRIGKEDSGWYRIADERLYELEPQKLTKGMLGSVEEFIKHASLTVSRNAKPKAKRASCPMRKGHSSVMT